MRHILLICLLLTMLQVCIADDQPLPTKPTKQAISMPVENLNLSVPTRTSFEFLIPPIPLLTSYWDYMIGGYSSISVNVQSQEAGNGVFLSYMGQRTPTGIRRVFCAYIDHEGNVVSNNEISSSQIREGYVSSDVDRVSVKPIFAWHSDADPSDPELEVVGELNLFPNGIPIPPMGSLILMDNPITQIINGSTITGNEFIWPVVQIGPSPTPDRRRVYVFASNASTSPASLNGASTENIYYAYADFNQQLLEEGNPLTWMRGSIPILDSWHVSFPITRKFFHTYIVGEDGNVYVAGHHITYDDGEEINEPYLDMFVNTNYGEGEWTQYSVNPDISVLTPSGESLKYCISGGSHNSGYVSPDGQVHFPLLFGFESLDGAYTYPLLQYLKDVEFNVVDHTFLINDLYPTGIHPNDGSPVLPWDINEDGIPDTNDEGETTMMPTWPFVYWDETALDGSMEFDYNTVKFTKMNEQGMVAAVWSSSLRAKFAITIPEYPVYPEVPEIFISVYPIAGSDGPQWSVPISLNSVETPELNPNNDPMIPEWAVPGDYIEYMGNSPEGYQMGKLHLMFFDDNSWGAASITPPVGQANGGKVMYTALKITWTPETVGVIQEPTASLPVLFQNYPNPFNPTTNISYNISQKGNVVLDIFNVKGQKVRSLVNEAKQIGNYTVTWDGVADNGSQVGSGVYFYRLNNNGVYLTKKMVMLK